MNVSLAGKEYSRSVATIRLNSGLSLRTADTSRSPQTPLLITRLTVPESSGESERSYVSHPMNTASSDASPIFATLPHKDGA